MGAVQASATQNVNPFIVRIFGEPMILGAETLLKDASRTIALAQYTLMGQIAATGKWIPWTSLTASDGTEVPLGILMTDGGVTAAALAAADVTSQQILVGGGVLIDGTQLVFDTGYGGGVSALTLNSVLVSNAAGSGSATPYWTMIAQRFLELRGIYVQGTVAFDTVEN